MNPLDLVKLSQLMELTSGRPQVLVGLVDGPVAMDHPHLSGENIREISGKLSGFCTIAHSAALTMPNYPIFDQPNTLFLPLWTGLGCDVLASMARD